MVRDAECLAASLLGGVEPRITHVHRVGCLAEAVAEHHSVSEDVVAAAWLHDIGYAPTVSRSGFHPLDGATYLRASGWPDGVVALVAYHTGAEWEAEERGISEPLRRFQQPHQSDLDNLNLFDLSIGPDGALMRPEQRLREILSRYEEDDPVHRAVMRSGPSLIASASRAQEALQVSYGDFSELLESQSSPARP